MKKKTFYWKNSSFYWKKRTFYWKNSSFYWKKKHFIEKNILLKKTFYWKNSSFYWEKEHFIEKIHHFIGKKNILLKKIIILLKKKTFYWKNSSFYWKKKNLLQKKTIFLKCCAALYCSGMRIFWATLDLTWRRVTRSLNCGWSLTTIRWDLCTITSIVTLSATSSCFIWPYRPSAAFSICIRRYSALRYDDIPLIQDYLLMFRAIFLVYKSMFWSKCWYFRHFDQN